jgi:hypothetical protein
MIGTDAREWLRREQMMRIGTNAPAIGCGGGRQFSSVSFAGFAAPLGSGLPAKNHSNLAGRCADLSGLVARVCLAGWRQNPPRLHP